MPKGSQPFVHLSDRSTRTDSPSRDSSDKSDDMVESCADKGEKEGHDDAASRTSATATAAAVAGGSALVRRGSDNSASSPGPDGKQDNGAEIDCSSDHVSLAIDAGKTTPTPTPTPATIETLRKAAADMRSTIPLMREAWGHVAGFCGRPGIRHDFERACGLLDDVAADIAVWARRHEHGGCLRIRSPQQQQQLLTEAHALVAVYNARQPENRSSLQRSEQTVLRIASLLALLDPTNAHRHPQTTMESLDGPMGRNIRMLGQRASQVLALLDHMARESGSVRRLHEQERRRASDDDDYNDCCCCLVILVVVVFVVLVLVGVAGTRRQQSREARDPRYATLLD
ncbi:uncharacterized protein J3D65DRAFT_666713 [Phyllosticta citribraziliensis]|uniref:Transmembrane protein n=1 Tax=Phyllosticta citribraziliensis TaxID=989973 RepID=A0ABR1LY22_9PEZI